jgi:hypothetical protein
LANKDLTIDGKAGPGVDQPLFKPCVTAGSHSYKDKIYFVFTNNACEILPGNILRKQHKEF